MYCDACKWVRVTRPSTDSWMTLQVNAPNLTKAEKIVRQLLPGWEVVNGCPTNPDTE